MDKKKEDEIIKAAKKEADSLNDAILELAAFQKRTYDAMVKVGFDKNQALYLTANMYTNMVKHG